MFRRSDDLALVFRLNYLQGSSACSQTQVPPKERPASGITTTSLFWRRRPLTSSKEEVEAGQLLPTHSGHLDTYSYGPQSPAQTRILRLHPKGFSPEGEARDDGMYADLVTVNLHTLEGVMT